MKLTNDSRVKYQKLVRQTGRFLWLGFLGITLAQAAPAVIGGGNPPGHLPPGSPVIHGSNLPTSPSATTASKAHLSPPLQHRSITPAPTIHAKSTAVAPGGNRVSPPNSHLGSRPPITSSRAGSSSLPRTANHQGSATNSRTRNFGPHLSGVNSSHGGLIPHLSSSPHAVATGIRPSYHLGPAPRPTQAGLNVTKSGNPKTQIASSTVPPKKSPPVIPKKPSPAQNANHPKPAENNEGGDGGDNGPDPQNSFPLYLPTGIQPVLKHDPADFLTQEDEPQRLPNQEVPDSLSAQNAEAERDGSGVSSAAPTLPRRHERNDLGEVRDPVSISGPPEAGFPHDPVPVAIIPDDGKDPGDEMAGSSMTVVSLNQTAPVATFGFGFAAADFVNLISSLSRDRQNEYLASVHGMLNELSREVSVSNGANIKLLASEVRLNKFAFTDDNELKLSGTITNQGQHYHFHAILDLEQPLRTKSQLDFLDNDTK